MSTLSSTVKIPGAHRGNVDSLGWRIKFGVIAPSTNTSVQPEFEAMRPRGVTNHFSRIFIPDDPVKSDEDFDRLMNNIRSELDNAVIRVKTCRPDHVVMGMSSETFWGGLEGSKRLHERVEKLAGVGVTMGSDAAQAALRKYGDVKRIAVITPYMPLGDEEVRKFFTECGFEVVAIKGLRCDSPVNIAHVQPHELRDAFIEVDDPSVEALVQAGTNLACAKVAMHAEFWLDKPVIAINTATYWHALRTNGIEDKIEGFGSLLSEF
ncbi:MAG TPA: arylmalonate decarboxylase [Candidatus Binatia bacterium]|nr:arylmalonate decarboxylase [Candidatus Binatia bacterium]